MHPGLEGATFFSKELFLNENVRPKVAPEVSKNFEDGSGGVKQALRGLEGPTFD